MKLSLFHLALWVLLGVLFEHSLRLDSAEGAIAGIEWLLAHPKHPPMPFWVIEIARQFGAFKYAALFTLSYSFMLLGVFVIVQFAKEQWGENAAKITLLTCLASPFLTYTPLQMNHNIALFPFWALVIVYGWKAIEGDRWQDWLILALAIAGGLYAKYAIALIVMPLLVYFIWQKRQVFISLKAYIAAIFAFILLVPHLYAEIKIIAFKTSPLHTFSNHFSDSLLHTSGFLLNCILITAPAVLVLKFAKVPLKPVSQLQKYAFLIAFLPMVFILSLALFVGIRPRPLWITPFILGVAFYVSAMLENRMFNTRPFYILYGVFVTSFIALKLLNPLFGKPTYSDYDAKATLKQLETYYERHTGSKNFPYLISLGAQRGRQLAGSLVFEMEKPVSVLEDAKQHFSPWINQDKIRDNGALVVSTRPISLPTYKIEHQEALPRPLKSYFLSWKDTPIFYVGVFKKAPY